MKRVSWEEDHAFSLHRLVVASPHDAPSEVIRALGMRLPARPLGLVSELGRTALWVAPRKYWLLAERAGGSEILINELPQLFATAGAALGDVAMMDITHGRSLLRIRGDGVAATLQQDCVFDLDQLSSERCVQTRIGGILMVLIRRFQNEFTALVPSSYSASFQEWLEVASEEAESTIQEFPS